MRAFLSLLYIIDSETLRRKLYSYFLVRGCPSLGPTALPLVHLGATSPSVPKKFAKGFIGVPSHLQGLVSQHSLQKSVRDVPEAPHFNTYSAASRPISRGQFGKKSALLTMRHVLTQKHQPFMPW